MAKILLVLLLGVSALVPPVAAHPTQVRDRRNDLGPGSWTPLDVKSVEQTHRRTWSTDHVAVRVEMHERFDNMSLQDVEGDYYALTLHFDVDDDRWFDRTLFVDAVEDINGYMLYAEMTAGDARDDGDGGNWEPAGRTIGFAKVWRPSDTSVKVLFPHAYLGASTRRFEYAVRAVSSPGPGEINFDYAPHGHTATGHT